MLVGLTVPRGRCHRRRRDVHRYGAINGCRLSSSPAVFEASHRWQRRSAETKLLGEWLTALAGAGRKDRMTSRSGSAQANAALVLESFTALNAGETTRLLTVVAPDLVMHLAGAPEPLHGRRPGNKALT
jgi:hypothetical protein